MSQPKAPGSDRGFLGFGENEGTGQEIQAPVDWKPEDLGWIVSISTGQARSTVEVTTTDTSEDAVNCPTAAPYFRRLVDVHWWRVAGGGAVCAVVRDKHVAAGR